MAEYFEMQNEDTSIISYDISVIPNDFNVMTINSLIESGIISMPAFQRNYVWDRKRASRFIESLILGLPVPQIFLYQMDRNKYSVIDGQQRLLTIYFFVKQRFPRSGKRTFLRKVFDENGNIPVYAYSDVYDAYVTIVCDNATVDETGFCNIGNTRILVGSQIYFSSGYLNRIGYCTRFEIKSAG